MKIIGFKTFRHHTNPNTHNGHNHKNVRNVHCYLTADEIRVCTDALQRIHYDKGTRRQNVLRNLRTKIEFCNRKFKEEKNGLQK